MTGQVGGALAVFLAAVLVSAAAQKLYSRERLVFATSRLLGVNAGLAFPVTLAAATVESASALALVIPATMTIGAVTAVILWAVYLAVLVAAVRRGETRLDCGCSFDSHTPGIDRFALMRPVVLMSIALAVVTLPKGLDIVAPFAALAFFAAYIAAGELAAIRRIVS